MTCSVSVRLFLGSGYLGHVACPWSFDCRIVCQSARCAGEGTPRVELKPFTVNTLIVHEVPKQVNGYQAPILSADASPLDEKSRVFLEALALRSIQNHGFSVEHDPDTKSPTPANIAALLADPAKELLGQSQSIASFLAQSQSGLSSEGLVVVAVGTCDSAPTVLIAKLEKAKGVRVVSGKTETGATVLQIQFVPDLMLSESTQLYKAGIFQKGDSSIEGYVSDHQNAGDRRHAIAQFFLTKFLGFKLTLVPKVATKSFADSVLTYVNTCALPAEKKADLAMSLQTELKSQRTNITPVAFARSYLPPEMNKDFMEHLRSSGAPTTKFAKDNELVRPLLKRSHLDFETGLMVSGPVEIMKERVRLRASKDGNVKVEFEDKFKKAR